jgi:hypothetical protein
MSAVTHHYREAVRLLELAPIDITLIPGTAGAAVFGQLAVAGPDGMSLPQLARVLGRNLADTEQLLTQLQQAGRTTRLETGFYAVPAAHQPTGSTSSPETSTSTTDVLLAALSHALLACTAASPCGIDLHDSHRPERG